MTDTVVDFTAGVPVRGDLNVRWIHGSPPGRRVSEPMFQVHACDPHTYLLRQSKTVSFEAPFVGTAYGDGHRIAPGRLRNLPFATSATWPPTSIRAISPAEPRGSTWIWLGRPVKRPW